MIEHVAHRIFFVEWLFEECYGYTAATSSPSTTTDQQHSSNYRNQQHLIDLTHSLKPLHEFAVNTAWMSREFGLICAAPDYLKSVFVALRLRVEDTMHLA